MVLLALSMLGVTIWASSKENLFQIFPRLLQQPWPLATIVDFYINLLLIVCWMAFRERSLVKILAWTVAFVALGSMATTLYIFLELRKLARGESAGRIFSTSRSEGAAQ